MTRLVPRPVEGTVREASVRQGIYGLERRIASEHPEELDLLGMDRMVRRAYESATSTNPNATRVWHDEEIRAARRSRDRRSNAGVTGSGEGE